MTPARALALAALAALAGCDDDASPDTPAPRSEALAGAEATGAALTVRIEQATPDPPIRSDRNTWRLRVLDADGAPLDGCAIEVEPTMPAHGHGTTPAPTVTAVDGEPGLYEARPLNLFMPGEWHIAVRPTCGSATDEIVFVVPIQS
ncbi:MAG: FixH family protein [bacterium]